MNLPRTVGVFLSGAVVYAVVAACSSTSSTKAGGGGADGGLVGTIVQDAMAVLDAIVSPTPEASAGEDAGASPGPTVNTVPCSGSFTVGTNTFSYAEQAYPGKTVADLSAVRAIANWASSANASADVDAPTGYASDVTIPFVRDGFVAVTCGVTSNANAIQSVTFVLPP